jgi:Phage terminase large subunit (GpA)
VSYAKHFADLQNLIDGKALVSPEAKEHLATFIEEVGFVDPLNGRLIDPKRNFWLAPLYDLKRSDIIANKYANGIVLPKPSQIGATTVAALFFLWLGVGDERLAIGMYWHTAMVMENWVKARFNPWMAHPKIKPYLAEDRVDTLSVKQIGSVTLYFMSVGALGGVDSVPLNIVWIDERRLMEDEIVEGIDRRMDDQEIRMKIVTSTAGAPRDGLEREYENSTQEQLHTFCEGCNCQDPKTELAGLPLNLMEPLEFIRAVDPPPQNLDDPRYEYFCKHSNKVIEPANPERNEFVAHNPLGRRRGLRFSGAVRPAVNADKIWELFEESKNRKEFYNATMGRAHYDPVGAVVLQAHIDFVQEIGKDYHGNWLNWTNAFKLDHVYAGADVRHEEIHVVFGTVDRVLWLEVIQGPQSFGILEQRMADMNVVRLVVDYQPETNATAALARKNRRVVLADYQQGARIRWGKPKKQLGVQEAVWEREMLLLDRTQSLSDSLIEFGQGVAAFPPNISRDGSNQRLMQHQFRDHRGRLKYDQDIFDEFAKHMRTLIRQLTPRKKKIEGALPAVVSGDMDIEIVTMGGPDHFAHAWNFYRAAILVDYENDVRVIGGSRRNVPTATKSFIRSEQNTGKRVCGQCRYFGQHGWCMGLGKYVAQTDPECAGFKRKSV